MEVVQLRTLNDKLGVPTMVSPNAAKPEPASGKAAPSKPAAPALTKFTTHLPDYLIHALKIKSAAEGKPANHYLMLGLQRLGFDVKEADLMPKRRT